MTPPPLPVAGFGKLPAHLLPFTIRALRVDSGEEVWSATIEDQPAAFRVPPLAREHGRVRIRIEWGDGSVTDD